MSIFKIQNEEGLFSTGGKSPSFNDRGKSWNSLGHLRNHLNSVLRKKNNPYKGAVTVVSFDLSPVDSAKVGSTIEKTFDNLSKVFTPDKYAEEKKRAAARAKEAAAEDAEILEHQKQLFAEFDAEHGTDDDTDELEVPEDADETVSSTTSSSGETPW